METRCGLPFQVDVWCFNVCDVQETSGLSDTIDYFVSFDGIEHPIGHTHYSEQLIRLHGFHSQFLPPMHLATPGHRRVDEDEVPSSAMYSRFASHNDASSSHVHGRNILNGKTATEILSKWFGDCGLSQSVEDDADASSLSCQVQPVYLCPQTLYKLHPWFDAVVSEILRTDGCGKVVFLHGNVESWDVIVVQRLASQFAVSSGFITQNSTLLSRPSSERCDVLGKLKPLLQRIVIAPQRGNNAFLEMLAAVDVVVDTFPFGEPEVECFSGRR